MAKLILKALDRSDEIIELKDAIFSIGNSSGCDLTLDSFNVADSHMQIIKDGNTFTIKDMDTLIGTFVNGSPINSVTLNDGDEITIDTYKLIFQSEEKRDEFKSPEGQFDSFLGAVTRKREITSEQLMDTAVPEGTYDILEDITQKSTLDPKYEEFWDGVRYKIKDMMYDLQTLVRMGKIVNSEMNLDTLLNLIMNQVIDTVGAQRGFIVLHHQKSGNLDVVIARGMEAKLDSSEKQSLSSSAIKKVIEEGKSYHSSNVMEDAAIGGQSKFSYNVKSCICVPLKCKQRTIGAIYLDHTGAAGIFDKAKVSFMENFANIAAIAIENARLYKIITDQERVRTTLQRFLSPDIVNKIMQDPNILSMKGQRQVATVLFSDIRGFTSLSKDMDPEVLVDTLNEYFTRMIAQVFKHKGTLDKLIGDCVMAVFGAPFSSGNDALQAIKAAIDMQNELEQFNREREQAGKFKLYMGIGINTGEVIAGNLGSEDVMEYTVMGNTVNVASRAQGLAGKDEIIITQPTYDQVINQVEVEGPMSREVKGINVPIDVYLVTGLKEKHP